MDMFGFFAQFANQFIFVPYLQSLAKFIEFNVDT